MLEGFTPQRFIRPLPEVEKLTISGKSLTWHHIDMVVCQSHSLGLAQPREPEHPNLERGGGGKGRHSPAW